MMKVKGKPPGLRTCFHTLAPDRASRYGRIFFQAQTRLEKHTAGASLALVTELEKHFIMSNRMSGRADLWGMV
jgi:hypothetical protein